MTTFQFFIRFGVHKDREILRSLREHISGMVVPAHILSYSTNATIAAIDYVNRPYYIDPMTYIYARENIGNYIRLDEKTKAREFKPSVSELTTDYDLVSFFEDRDYGPITPDDFNDAFTLKLVQKNIALQCQKVDAEKAGAYKKYADLLGITKELDKQHSPAVVIPPYFFFKNQNDPWFSVNQKLAKITKEQTSDEVAPIIFTNSSSLSAELLDHYKDFSKLFLWVDDLDEKEENGLDNQIDALKRFVAFVTAAKEKNIEIYNMYGSYFSILLSKLGLAGICNGSFYGEYKTRTAKVGGVPVSRYYIRALHEFFAIPDALKILKKYPELVDTESNECMELINGDIDNIYSFSQNHALAQAHFIYSRNLEIREAEIANLTDLVSKITSTYEMHKNNFPSSITRKSIDYLNAWKDALPH